MAVPEVGALVTREIEAFRSLYPKADIRLRIADSRTGVTDLLSHRTDLVVVARELEPEERTVPVEGGMELDGYRFARDGLCFIVHPSNRLAAVSVDELKQMFQGHITDWKDIGGTPGRIERIVPDPATDMMTSFTQRVLGGEIAMAPAVRSSSDSLTVAMVMRTPGAIGFVPMAWSDRGARTLRVSALRGLPDWKPDAERVYKGDYPLTRYFNLYVRSAGPKLANGFITFVCSRDGQKLVHESGVVPTAVPVRFVRRSPLIGTH